MLAFHPVKMQSCYEKMEQLNLEGLQQRFEVSSPSVFISRAQILMREVRRCSTSRRLDKVSDVSQSTVRLKTLPSSK